MIMASCVLLCVIHKWNDSQSHLSCLLVFFFEKFLISDFIFVCTINTAVNCFAYSQWLRICIFLCRSDFRVYIIKGNANSIIAEKKSHLLMAIFQSFHFMSWRFFVRIFYFIPKLNYAVEQNRSHASQMPKAAAFESSTEILYLI